VRRRIITFAGAAAAAALLTPTVTTAHELAETSATVIVRPGGHVQLRLQIPYADLLRREWMPRESEQNFLMTATNMPAAKFARELAKVHETIEHHLRVHGDGNPAALTHWTWPSAAAVQSALRTRLMAMLATPGEHAHGERIEVDAETRLVREPGTVQLYVPPVLGPTLLTVYRPEEQWVRPGALSRPVSVGRQ
jgi:hypothetical protein